MRTFLVAACCLALGLAATTTATAQGPVRQGLRRAGEVVVDGTGRVIQGAADVTRGVVGGAADVTRGAVQGTARGVAATADALTPGLPVQARAGANLSAADASRDARWRFQQHNGEWWYYTPQNQWMYHRDGRWNDFAQDSFQPNPAFAGEYGTGYRGMEQGQYADQGVAQQGYVDQGYQYQGPAYTLHRDSYGREFICENGRRVYVNSQPGAGGAYGTGYRGMEGEQFQGQQGPMTPTPAIPHDPNAPNASIQQGTTTQQQSTLQGQTGATGQASGQTQTGASSQVGASATTPSTTTPSNTVPAPSNAPATTTAPQSGNTNAGELSPESPRDVLQSSGSESTQGTLEPGQTAR
jgi:hypothetical protein